MFSDNDIKLWVFKDNWIEEKYWKKFFIKKLFTFKNMKAYGGLSPAGWLAGVVAPVPQLHCVNREETQGSATLPLPWTDHLGDDMDPAPGVNKPWVMDIPDN